MTTTPNQLSYWYTGQLVTSAQMNEFSQDIYARITDITETLGNLSQGCILNIGAISQTGGNVTIAAGSFRFPDVTLAYLPYNTGIIGNAAAATVAVTGNGFIVARYVVSPTSTNNTNYTFTVTYVFTASVNPSTDCIICVITSGVISGYGTFFANPDIQDNNITGAVTIGGRIVGASNLLITTNTAIGGNTPESNIATETNGNYTQSLMNSTNGVSGSLAQITTNYTDGGNGTFKPSLSFDAGTTSYGVTFQINAAGSGTSYNGLSSALINYADVGANTYSIVEQFPDSNNLPYMNLGVYQTGSSLVNMQFYNNGTSWMRVEMDTAVMGGIGELGVTANSLLCFQDVQSGITNNAGTSYTVTLAEAMPDTNYSVMISPSVSPVSTGTYYAIITSPSQFFVSSNTGSLTQQNFYWIAVWNGV